MKGIEDFRIVREGKVESGHAKIWTVAYWSAGGERQRKFVSSPRVLAEVLADIFSVDEIKLWKTMQEELIPEIRNELNELRGGVFLHADFPVDGQVKTKVKQFTKVLEIIVSRSIQIVNTLQKEDQEIEDWLFPTMQIYP